MFKFGNKIERTQFILILLIIVVSLTLITFLSNFIRRSNGEYFNQETNIKTTHTSSKLFIPKLVDLREDGASVDISVENSVFSFFENRPVNVLSYNNQGYLGNTLLLKRGTTVFPKVTNNLDQSTTLHWHGLEVNGANDGAFGDEAIIKPKDVKHYQLKVDQQAATLWYHPHAMGSTSSQVYEGLAGMIIIEDDNSTRLNLPNEYGVNDIPLVIQAKLFNHDGTLYYGPHGLLGSSHMGNMMNESMSNPMMFEDGSGDPESTTRGFTIMSNGHYAPYFEVSNGLVRIRLLNGSNHGVIDVSTKSSVGLEVIATDGGLLEEGREISNLEIAAGERYEVLIDLSSKKNGERVDVYGNGQVVLTFVIETEVEKVLPENDLNSISLFEDYIGQQETHLFVLKNDLINDQEFDPSVTTFSFKKDTVYYFRVQNDARENHSFHIHNSQFLIIEKNGDIVNYKEYGFKDTIYLKSKESYLIQVVFKHEGYFMYHCHILSHEENGMMGKFHVY